MAASCLQRGRVNDRVMKDPQLARMMKEKERAFDSKRMDYGGFKAMVDA